MKKKLALLVLVSFMFMAVATTAFAKLEMANGWSINDDESVAVQEAFDMMKKKIGDPQFIFLATSGVTDPKIQEGYDVEAIAKKASALRGSAVLLGTVSRRAVFSNDGIHRGNKGGVAIMGMKGEDFKAGTGIALLADTDSAAEKIKKMEQAILDAVKMAGKTTKDKPAFIYVSNLFGQDNTTLTSEEGLKAVKRILGDDIPLVGGVTNFDDFNGAFNIANEKIGKQGVAYAILYTKSKVGAAFHSGCIGVNKTGTVTKVDGTRRLVEINNRPAFDVYKEWAGGKLDDVNIAEEPIVMKTGFFPLARGIDLPNGDKQYVAVHPFKFFKDKSLWLGVDVTKGEKLHYVEGDLQSYIKRTGTVARNALLDSGVKKKDMAGGIHIYCAGASSIVGEENWPALVQEVKNVMGDVPFVGAFTGGEEGYSKGYGYHHFNLASSMVIFGK